MLNTSHNGDTVDCHALILSSATENGLVNLPPEVELATVRQMMETLFVRVQQLQQNQAIQLAGVHDRLDAVELELPLIQEQGALRMRDLEARMSEEIDEAARSAVQEATAAATAVVQEEVARKFNSVATQMEAQHKELSRIRESKEAAEMRLNRAIMDVERLCTRQIAMHLGQNAQRPDEEPRRPRIEPVASLFHSRVAGHIRHAATDMAPGEDNSVIDSVPSDGISAALSGMTPPAAVQPVSPDPLAVSWGLTPEAHPAVLSARVSSTPAGRQSSPAGRTVPDFDAWKRQFMQDGEPLSPAFVTESEDANGIVVCPRCYSVRTRLATLNRWDHVFRLAKFTPYRCRSCSHRFYRRSTPSTVLDRKSSGTRTPDAMGTQ